MTKTDTTTNVGIKKRLTILVINYFQFFHLFVFFYLLFIPYDYVGLRVFYALLYLYLFPPFLALPMRKFFKIREGKISDESRDYIIWWSLFNLQVLFCRFPILEELLRVVPGTYSIWLRLWGAKIGKFTYWAPGVIILDRSFVNIGDNVVFGAGVHLNPHVITVNDDCKQYLILGTVKIGNNAIVGGYSLLTAGSEVAEKECLRAFFILPPFSKWEKGKRVKKNEARI